MNQPIIETINPLTTSHTFFNVVMRADLTPSGGYTLPIDLTASFVGTNCSNSFTDVGPEELNSNGQSYNPPRFKNAPRPCSTCLGPESSVHQFNAPACWPPSVPQTICDDPVNYSPQQDVLEHTPIKYIKVVVHIFQQEGPNNPQNFTPAHASLIKSWFDDPQFGLNAFYSNLCDSPNDGIFPPITDSRIRFLNNAEENVDLFFHQDNEAWGTGYSGCTFVDPDVDDDYVYQGLGPGTLTTNYINTLPLESRNAFHVFLTGGRWEDYQGPGATNQNEPGPEDCYYFCPGGFTNNLNDCTNPPRAVISGQYHFFEILTGGTANNCNVDMSNSPSVIGTAFAGELFHFISLDHISPLQAHAVGGDFCDDTPWEDAYNKMGCGDGPRCALTPCQLGRIHYSINHNDFVFERFKTGPNQYSTTEPSFCDLTEPDLIVPFGSEVLWAYPRQIRSNVIVEPGGKLTINCDVGMPENARITVQAQGTLIIDGARIYSNCDGDYWDGIVVEGKADKTQQFDYVNNIRYQGYLLIQKGAVIEEALSAVQCQDPSNSYKTGGIVIAVNSTFRNCKYRFISIKDYQNSNLSTNQKIGNASYFSRCNFIIDDAYSGSFVDNFQEMVYIRNVDGIDFHGCNFRNSLPESMMGANTYADYHKIGIRSANAGLEVKGACNGNTDPCNDWTMSEFSGFFRAIDTGIYGSSRTFSVTRSRFSDNLAGIYAAKVDNAYIVNNIFEVGSELPVLQPQNSDAANRGIELWRCSGYKVEANTLARGSGAGTTNPVGILVNNSGEMPNEVYKNELSELNIGNLSNGRNRHHDPTEIKGLQYLCNTNTANTEHDFAVPFEKGAVSYGIRGQQGAVSLAAGNTFTAVSGTNTDRHFHNEQNNITYFYFNQGNQVPTDVTPLKVIPTNTFSNNLCPSRLPSDKERGRLSEQEKQQFQSDFDNQNNTLETRAYAADMLIRNYLIDTTGVNFDSIRYLLTQKGDLYSRFGVVDTWLQESNADSAQQALSAIPSQITLTDELLTEYDYFDTLKSLQINALQNGISDDTLVVNNKTTLVQVAEAGKYYASVQAQVLLNSVNGITYIPDVTLPSDSSQNLMSPPPTHNINSLDLSNEAVVEALPNPAQHRTVFRYRLPGDAGQGHITVTDLDGRTIAIFEIEGSVGSVNWDVKSVNEGIYLYQLVSDKVTLPAKRLVIVH